MAEWISVEERLPEIGQIVIIYAVGTTVGFNKGIGRVEMSQFYRGLNNNARWNGLPGYFLKDHEITHWMPLPEPPQ